MVDPGASGWADHASRLRDAVWTDSDPEARTRLGAALQAIGGGDFDKAETLATRAGPTPASASAWRIAAMAREGRGDLPGALEALQAAQGLDPASADILADLGRLAQRLEMHAAAAQLFTAALEIQPGSAHLTEQLAAALRDQHDYHGAATVLKAALQAAPDEARLWNALGAVLLQEGETDTALAFLDEAVRLSPTSPEALYNRAVARLELSDLAGAVADCDAALPLAEPSEKAQVRFARAQAKLASGDLNGGWTDYAARLDPHFPKAPRFDLPGRRWSMGDAVEGRGVLLVGEQGLGDEMMFAGMAEDLLAALGPSGRLTLAVAPRLVALFRRSFPAARVLAYERVTEEGRTQVAVPETRRDIDLWAPMGDLTPKFRVDMAAFDAHPARLVPDAAAVRDWRSRLDALGPEPKIGLAWKSGLTTGHRLKQYPRFEDWEVVLATPGVRFVKLQYGDCGPELAAAVEAGNPIWSAPGLDLTNDLDGAAALSAATDLVIGVGNASTNLAAAVGRQTWVLASRHAWPRLGTDHYPWYADTRGFVAERFGAWEKPMAEVAAALAAWRDARA
jgi:tetratricopeptide (TPR) repeat protein